MALKWQQYWYHIVAGEIAVLSGVSGDRERILSHDTLHSQQLCMIISETDQRDMGMPSGQLLAAILSILDDNPRPNILFGAPVRPSQINDDKRNYIYFDC